jgi:hypothetical protein
MLKMVSAWNKEHMDAFDHRLSHFLKSLCIVAAGFTGVKIALVKFRFIFNWGWMH